MKLRRLAPLLLIIGLVSACGSVHPGAAAVVNGETITRSTADELAHTYCVFVSGQGKQASQLDARRQATADLIVEKVMNKAFADEDVSIAAVEYQVSAEERAELETYFGADTDAIVALIERNNRVHQGAQEIVKRIEDSISDEDLPQFAQQLILQYVEQADVSIDPRFGIANDLSSTIGSRSVSVAAHPNQTFSTPRC